MDKEDKPRGVLATFRSGHELAVDSTEGGETVLIRAVDGTCVLRIEMGPSGPVVQVTGASLEIAATEKLSLSAPRLEVKAGSVAIDAESELTLKTARGMLSLEAGDDVDIRGERVRLNTPDLPMPLSWEEFRERERAATRPAGPAGQEGED